MNRHPSPFRRKPHDAHEGGIESWLMSYADMITLLLCFFVIFIATSEPKKDRLAAATSGIKDVFGSVKLNTPFTGAYKTIEGIIDTNQAYQSMSVEKNPRGLRIELASAAYFEPGSATISPAALSTLMELADALKDSGAQRFDIAVEGHTDDTAPEGDTPSNWDLSALQATRIVRFLQERKVGADAIRAEAYADSDPKVPNRNGAGEAIPANQERNRRIIIRVERKP